MAWEKCTENVFWVVGLRGKVHSNKKGGAHEFVPNRKAKDLEGSVRVTEKRNQRARSIRRRRELGRRGVGGGIL